MRDQTNYLKLMMAIAGGVVVGGVVLWFVRGLLSVGLFSALVSSLNLDTTGREVPAAVTTPTYVRDFETQNAARMREQREQSASGKAYWRECQEWALNYKMTPTETTRINGKYYCDRYSRFIETGRVSIDKPPY